MSFKKIALATGLSFATVFGISAPANAAPLAPQPIVSPAASLVDQVGYKHRRGLYKRYGITYYNGYRGHRYRRAGYRYHRGHYFPRRAFSIQVYVGPRVIYKPRHTKPRVLRVNNRHISYCYSKYRSYRASDNTFQPYNGGRRACRSPYAR